VAVAVFDAIEKDRLLDHVNEVGSYFHQKLADLQQKHSAITEIRGLGLMLAAELDSAELAKTVLAEMLRRRILINRTSETVLRFLPPFILGKEHVDEAIEALDTILTEHSPAHAGEQAHHINGGTHIG
jgi:acetylornithine aminotransferase/acetylornithine/N-succinyldiaminopimelate aminotransferase